MNNKNKDIFGPKNKDIFQINKCVHKLKYEKTLYH